MNEVTELNEFKFSAYPVGPLQVKLSELIARNVFITLRCDSTNGRRSRGAAVASLSHAIRKRYGVTLERVAVSYSETQGFLWRTEVRYRIDGRTWEVMAAQTAKAERDTYAAMIEHTSPRVCHTCFLAYGKSGTDEECMNAMCADGRRIRQAWLDAFVANGNRRG